MQTQGKNATIHQLITMLSTCKNVLFPGHNHLLTTSADGSTLIITKVSVTVIIKVSGHQPRWLTGGNDLEIGHFRGGYHGG